MTISDHRDLVAALLGVPGVAAAAVEPLGEGPGTLRLQLVLRRRRGRRRRRGEPPAAQPVRPRGGRRPGAGARGIGACICRTCRYAGGAHPRPVREPAAEPRTVTDAVGAPAAPAAAPAPRRAARRRPRRGTGRDRVRPGRLVIERVQLVSAGLGVSVSVTLRSGDRVVVGEAEGAATALALHRLVAEATLRAVEAVVEHGLRFDVEHVEIAATGEERTALVVVSMLTDRATQRLSGASVVREDVRQAVIRAVLAAVNRRVEPMLAAGEESV